MWGAFLLGDVIGKICLPWCPPTPPVLALSITPPFFLSSVRSWWQLCTVISFCMSSPHPEHVPPIRSRQRNAWKKPTAKKPLSLPWEDTGGMTGRGGLTHGSFLYWPPSVSFSIAPQQAGSRVCTVDWKENSGRIIMPLYTVASLACPGCTLCSCWLWLGGKMNELDHSGLNSLGRECGKGAHDPESVSYQNTVHIHYELIWIKQFELRGLFIHLWLCLPYGWHHLAVGGNDCIHYPFHLQRQPSWALWEFTLRDYTTFSF